MNMQHQEEEETSSPSSEIPAGAAVVGEPQWTPWEATGPCKSACITRSKGFQKLSRSCIIRSTNATNAAEGHSIPSTTTTVVETRWESDFALKYTDETH